MESVSSSQLSSSLSGMPSMTSLSRSSMSSSGIRSTGETRLHGGNSVVLRNPGPDTPLSRELCSIGFLKTPIRTPAILVQPVFAHRLPLSRHVQILRLPAADAEILYRRRFATTEFLTRDIDAVLSNQLSMGTYLAVEREFRWEGIEAFLEAPPESWAVVSVWNSKEVFRLEVRGASRWWRGLAQMTRAVDRALPWLSHTSLGRFVALPPLVSVPFATQSSMIFSAASPLSLLSSTSLATWALGSLIRTQQRVGTWE